MAHMIPDQPPQSRDTTKSEKSLWWDLKRKLSDEFYVYHSLPYLRADANQGEVDFLILHRHYGMLNLECKGFGIDRDESGQWYRKDLNGQQRQMGDPTEQATDQIKSIVRHMREPAFRALGKPSTHDFPVVYGWALAFPFSRTKDLNLPMSLEPEIVIGSTRITGDLEDAVIEAMEFYAQLVPANKMRLDEEQFAKFRHVISPPMKIKRMMIGAQIDREKESFIKLSESQIRAVRQIMDNRRVRIPGGAGTGKTVLAIASAKWLAARGENVLLTCFNKSLGHHLREQVDDADLPGTIDAIHFHGLCCNIADKDLGGVLDYPDRDASEQEHKEFWREESAFALMQAVDEGVLSVGPWDAIIVDEGQDFHKSWWPILADCYSDPETGRLVVFHDDEQAIFDHEPQVPTDCFKYGLYENFRNTKAIAKNLLQLADIDFTPHPGVPDGTDPVLYQQPGPSKTRKLLAKLIDELVHDEGLDYGEIVILSPRSKKNCALQGAKKLGDHPITSDLGKWGKALLHSTIGSFKGLESNVVILIDIHDGKDGPCSRSDRYVAASRAIHRLYVFARGNWLD